MDLDTVINGLAADLHTIAQRNPDLLDAIEPMMAELHKFAAECSGVNPEWWHVREMRTALHKIAETVSSDDSARHRALVQIARDTLRTGPQAECPGVRCPRDTSGPAGTYGCACVSRDARNCLLMRSGYRANCDGFDERCECLCHKWDVDDPQAADIGTVGERRADGPAHSDYPCRSDGRCQYAIDHGAEGMGHCPRGMCAMAPR